MANPKPVGRAVADRRAAALAGPAATARQRQVLDFIAGYVRENGYPPTYPDIMAATGIRSPNGVTGHLRALERKGLLAPRGRADGKVGRGRARALRVAGVNAGGLSLPLLGRVAAGPPLEAVPEAERLDLRALFGEPGLFAVRLDTDALKPAAMARGDHLVLRAAGPADGGRTVAAESADGAVGLYTLLGGRAGVRLDPRAGPADPAARVLGVVVGVLRGY